MKLAPFLAAIASGREDWHLPKEWAFCYRDFIFSEQLLTSETQSKSENSIKNILRQAILLERTNLNFKASFSFAMQ